MNSELIRAINQIAAEKELSKQVILDAVEAALISAYRRNFGTAANVTARIDPETGEISIYAQKEVVEEVKDPRTQISLEEARKIDPNAQIGSRVAIESTPKNFGRIAAQTAKQVILQRIKEAERETVYQYFEERVGEIVQGKVQSVDYSTGTVTVNLDRAEGTMTKEDQIPSERYRPGHTVRALLVEVHRGNRGPIIRLSRSHRNLLRRLLEKEVPEIFQGSVEIKAIAREPGQRSKVAVAPMQPGVDPVGSCVGMRGMRIQAIVNELNGEKIDIVEWSPDTATFIANALSPAKVTDVILEETPDNRTAIVIVPDNQLSLAIGKEGQNARLAAKLTGWRIDIKSESEAAEEGLDQIAAERRRMAETIQASGEKDLLAVAEEILRRTSKEDTSRTFDEALEAAMAQTAGLAPFDLELEGLTTDISEAPTTRDEAHEAESETAAPASEQGVTGAVEEGDPAGTTDEEGQEAAATPITGELEIEGIDAILDDFEEDLDEEDEGEEGGRKRKKRKKKGKKRRLLYDEETGQTIALRRHKRPSQSWEDYDEDYDF
ncbi:MAG TPA: transcription termination/antitermination protein NusA [Caldilineae bacterium]|nr:transcription termination/antitermination protein NusA [Caldilineae bacterium]